MAKSEEEIKRVIKSFIDKNGGAYKDWYVGISDDAERRLFYGHNVNEKDLYTHERANSADVARRVEKYFVKELETDGGQGGGDENTKEVYAYKKKAHTNP